MNTNFRLFLFTLLLSILLSQTAVAQQSTDWAKLGKYAQQNKNLPALCDGKPRVVFFGNSITELWVKEHPDFFKANNYIGRGISGQTSYHFVVRFRPDVVDIKADIVVINAGTNDIAENICPFDAEITMGNIRSMVEIAQANSIKPILTSLLPASHFYWNNQLTNVAEKIELLNQMISEYASQKGIDYVNYYSSMVYGEDKALNPKYTSDGVHPNIEGYKVMESIISQAVGL